MLTTAQRWSTIFRACRDPQHRCPRHPGSLGIGVSATRRGRRLESGGRRLTAELPRRKVVAVTDVLEGAPAGRPRANGSGRGAAAADRCLEELLGALRGARAGNLCGRPDAAPRAPAWTRTARACSARSPGPGTTLWRPI